MNYRQLDVSFEDYLINIALTATQAGRIDRSLEEVTRIMLEELSGTDIYVQGSFATATTVKPLTEYQSPGNPGEYDVDIVIERSAWGSPQEALNRLAEILSASETFSGMQIEVKSKCVRVDFPPDATSTAFHIDVVPILNDNGVRKVANGDTNLWQESDSKALIEWFLQRKLRYPYMPALVMMIKRIRDVGLLTDAIPSITIQAIVVANYQNKGTYAADLVHMLKCFDDLLEAPRESLNIPNPVNARENLADRWRSSPKEYESLRRLFSSAREVVQTELESLQPDTGVLREVLSSDFPSELASSALDSLRGEGYSINSDKFLGKLEVEHQSAFGRLVDAVTRVFFEINKSITFTAPRLKIPRYNIKWQVLNSAGSPSRRGNLFSGRAASGGEGSSSDIHKNHENEQYVGSHWIRYFVFDEDTKQCIGRSQKINVTVKGNQGYGH